MKRDSNLYKVDENETARQQVGTRSYVIGIAEGLKYYCACSVPSDKSSIIQLKHIQPISDIR